MTEKNKIYFMSFDSHDHYKALDKMEDWINDEENLDEIEILQMSTAATNSIYIITVMYKLKE